MYHGIICAYGRIIEKYTGLGTNNIKLPYSHEIFTHLATFVLQKFIHAVKITIGSIIIYVFIQTKFIHAWDKNFTYETRAHVSIWINHE